MTQFLQYMGHNHKTRREIMKRVTFLLAALLLLAVSANATLIDLGNGIASETWGDETVYWYLDPTAFLGLTYGEQKSAIAGLGDFGIPGLRWGMADSDYFDRTLSLNSYEALESLFTAIPGDDRWRIRDNQYQWGSPYAETGWHYAMIYNGDFTHGGVLSDSDTTYGALALGMAPTATPIPAPVLLIGTGLIGLAWLKRKFLR